MRHFSPFLIIEAAFEHVGFTGDFKILHDHRRERVRQYLVAFFLEINQLLILSLSSVAKIDQFSINSLDDRLRLFLKVEKWLSVPIATTKYINTVEVGRERAGKRSAPDRFEQERDAFFNRVRETYLARAKADSSRIKTVDASGDLLSVQKQIKTIFENL